MRRILLVLSVAALMAVMLVAMAGPALAAPGKCEGACRGLYALNPGEQQNNVAGGETRNCGDNGSGKQKQNCWGDSLN
jgi:hypothetical protein